MRKKKNFCCEEKISKTTTTIEIFSIFPIHIPTYTYNKRRNSK
jgi:hypothetical protein